MTHLWRAHHASDALEVGREVDLSPREAHHVFRVLRLGPGARLAVFDGAGREHWATVVRAGRGGVRVRLGEPRADVVEAPLEVALFQGWCRPERMAWLLQKATEVGVTAIHPVRTARWEGPDPSPRVVERWRRVALEACKQCGRRRAPAVEPVEAIPAPPADARALLLDPDPRSPELRSALAGDAPRTVWIAIGPQGGFEETEVQRLVGCGWSGVRLGPRILRSETAAAVAAALVLHRWGDLG